MSLRVEENVDDHSEALSSALKAALLDSPPTTSYIIRTSGDEADEEDGDAVEDVDSNSNEDQDISLPIINRPPPVLPASEQSQLTSAFLNILEKSRTGTLYDANCDAYLINYCTPASTSGGNENDDVYLDQYKDESELPEISRLMAASLSEPYNIYVYRFFLHNWPELCILLKERETSKCIGAIIGKIEERDDCIRCGYVGMLAVDPAYRRRGYATRLIRRIIHNMIDAKCSLVYLETEAVNESAQKLYMKLGFMKDQRLERYYLNGNDAFRLILPLDLTAVGGDFGD